MKQSFLESYLASDIAMMQQTAFGSNLMVHFRLDVLE